MVCCVIGGAFPHTANAFRCTTTSISEGVSASWFSRTISLSLFHEGADSLSRAQKLEAIRSAFDAWANAESCDTGKKTDLALGGISISATDRIGYDWLSPDENENLIKFHDTDWPYDPIIAPAISVVTFSVSTGEIIDVDIELNSEHFDFEIDSDSPDSDLTRVLTKQIGHLLGLTSSNRSSVMFPGYGTDGLQCDDRNAIVFKYPSMDLNGYCSPPDEACGYCAAPIEPTTMPLFRVVGSNNGMGRCD